MYIRKHSTGTNIEYRDAHRWTLHKHTHTFQTISDQVTKATLPLHSHTSHRGEDTANTATGTPLAQKIHNHSLLYMFILWRLSSAPGIVLCAVHSVYLLFLTAALWDRWYRYRAHRTEGETEARPGTVPCTPGAQSGRGSTGTGTRPVGDAHDTDKGAHITCQAAAAVSGSHGAPSRRHTASADSHAARGRLGGRWAPGTRPSLPPARPSGAALPRRSRTTRRGGGSDAPLPRSGATRRLPGAGAGRAAPAGPRTGTGGSPTPQRAALLVRDPMGGAGAAGSHWRN